MNPLFHLDNMLSEYQSVFKYNNFSHFATFVKGLIVAPHRGTMTQIYRSIRPSRTYWTGPKFLSRGKWDIDEPTSVLIKQVQEKYNNGVNVYDESHSLSDGEKQYGGH